MEKLKQIKINYWTNLKDAEKMKCEEISLVENRMLRLYCRYKDIELKDGIKLDNILKVILAEDYDIAKEQIVNGIEINGRQFKYLISSPSMMKIEATEETKNKCECLFIEESEYDFKRILEKVDSLDKMKKLKEKDEISINKDIVARLSLSLSGSYYINYQPKIIILPSTTFKATSNNYCTFIKNDKGYKFIEKGKEVDNVTPTFDFADGCGFFNPKLEPILKAALKTKQKIDFIGIRKSALAVKGLCVKADLHKLFDDLYDENIKYDYFRKDSKGNYWTLDIYNKWQNISKADLVINTNMAKWWKNFEYLKDTPTKIDEEMNNIIKKDEELQKYSDLITGLEITKINKANLQTHTLTAYQLINNTMLTPKEISELSADTERYLGKIIKGDIDATRLYYKDIARESQEEISASTKVQKLLQINENTIKTHIVSATTNRNIEKTANQLAGGRFYVKGNYKTCCICPVTYARFIMMRGIDTTNGLQAHEFYVPKEVGNRVMNRYPQAVFSETHKIKLVKNELLDKHFGHLTSELIFFNQADSMASICSGLDYDLDFVGVWDNKTLYDAVIEPKDGRHFLNTMDNGDTVKLPYNIENEAYSILKASGNIIGSIANITTKLSNYAQELGYIQGEEYYRWKELRDYYSKEFLKDDLRKIAQLEEDIVSLKAEKKLVNKEEKEGYEQTIDNIQDRIYTINKKINGKFQEYLDMALQEKKFIWLGDCEEKVIKKYLMDQFYSLREEMYYALLMSQLAIDAPKTLVVPDKDDLARLKPYKKMKYPTFLHYYSYTKNRENIKYIPYEQCQYSHTALNINASRINKEIIKPLREQKNRKDNSSEKNLIYGLFKDKCIENKKCADDLKKLYSAYRKNREKYKGNTEKLNIIDIKGYEKYEQLRKKYNDEELGDALIKARITSRFLINCCYNTFENLLKDNEFETTAYVEDIEGNIDWKFKKYRKVKAKLRNKNLQLIDVIEKKQKLGQEVINLKVAKTENKLLEKAVISIIDKKVNFINNNGENMGFAYNNLNKKTKKYDYDLNEGRKLNDSEFERKEVKVNVLEECKTYYKVAIEL